MSAVTRVAASGSTWDPGDSTTAVGFNTKAWQDAVAAAKMTAPTEGYTKGYNVPWGTYHGAATAVDVIGDKDGPALEVEVDRLNNTVTVTALNPKTVIRFRRGQTLSSTYTLQAL